MAQIRDSANTKCWAQCGEARTLKQLGGMYNDIAPLKTVFAAVPQNKPVPFLSPFFFFSFCFLGPYLRNMEVPRLGVESELYLPAYTTATATQDSSHIRAVTYTTAHSNTGPLTHWARPGIEPASSWIPVRFTSMAPQRELHLSLLMEIKCPLFTQMVAKEITA